MLALLLQILMLAKESSTDQFIAVFFISDMKLVYFSRPKLKF